MKRRIISILLVLVMTVSLLPQLIFVADAEDSDVEIAKWSGFRKTAVCFTFDDGAIEQRSHCNSIAPAFDKYGYKATFYVVTDWMDSKWDDYKELANRGHEIGSHSVSHSVVNSELSTAKRIIEENIGKPCLTHSYVNGNVLDTATVLNNYIAARALGDGLNRSSNPDCTRINSQILGSEGLNKKTAITGKIQNAIDSDQWVTFFGHGIQGVTSGSSYSPLSYDALTGSLDWIHEHDNEVWATSLCNAIMYLKERDDATFKQTSATGSQLTYSLTLSSKLTVNKLCKWNYPLSLRISLPRGWETVSVTQNGKELDSCIKEGKIYFDAVPNGGEIVVCDGNGGGDDDDDQETVEQKYKKAVAEQLTSKKPLTAVLPWMTPGRNMEQALADLEYSYAQSSYAINEINAYFMISENDVYPMHSEECSLSINPQKDNIWKISSGDFSLKDFNSTKIKNNTLYYVFVEFVLNKSIADEDVYIYNIHDQLLYDDFIIDHPKENSIRIMAAVETPKEGIIGNGWYLDSMNRLYIYGSIVNSSLNAYDLTPWKNYKSSIRFIYTEPGASVNNAHRLFCGCTALYRANLGYLNLYNVLDFSYMFADCPCVEDIDFSNTYTGDATDMSYMFENCQKLDNLYINNFNTENVEDMCSMFRGCNMFSQGTNSFNISGFCTKNVTNMWGMFFGCRNMSSLDLRHFDTSNVETMAYMFQGCLNLESLDISSFDTSKVVSMSAMFSSCKKMKEFSISHFNTAKVDDMNEMFSNCQSLTKLDVSGFDTSSDPDLTDMLTDCISLNELTSNDGMLNEDTASQLFELSPEWKNKATGEVYYNITKPVALTGIFTLKRVNEVTTHTLSGRITSFSNAADTVSIGLYKTGQSTPAYTHTVTGNSADYTISGIAAGTYTMTVSKTKHATCEYTITVGNADIQKNVTLYLLGDVNIDGEVDALDATQITRYSNGKSSVFGSTSDTELEAARLKVGDVNDDGEVDALDATQITRYSNGKPSIFDAK